MFKSSPKKESLPHWTVQILTQDYLLEGDVQLATAVVSASEAMHDFLRVIQMQLPAAHGSLAVTLTAARMQPSGRLVTPPQTFTQLVVDLRSVVALLPTNAECTSTLRDSFASFKFPVAANFAAGPYWIRGNLLADSQSGEWDTTIFVPVADAQIDCQFAESKLTGLHAPWLLLNALLVQAAGH